MIIWRIPVIFVTVFGSAGNLYTGLSIFFEGYANLYLFSCLLVGFVSIYAHFVHVCCVSARCTKHIDFLLFLLDSHASKVKRRTRICLWSAQTVFWALVCIHLICYVSLYIQQDFHKYRACSLYFPTICGVNTIYLQVLDSTVHAMHQTTLIGLHVYSVYLSMIITVFSCHLSDISSHMDFLLLHYHNNRKFLNGFMRLGSFNMLASSVYLLQKVLRVTFLLIASDRGPDELLCLEAAVATFASGMLICASLHLNLSVSQVWL